VIGILIGALVGFVATGVHTGWSGSELEAENRQLRAGLRYVRGIITNRGELPSLVRYVDRLLDDEAGA
jgi:hypothetical protein